MFYRTYDKRCRIATRQQGFVLVLALVLLAVMTLIGVSSMNSASMEMKASANAQQHQLAFNAVQSLIEFLVSDQGTTPVIDYQVSDPALTQTATTTVAGAAGLTADVVLSACSAAVGYSLEDGKAFRFNYFNIEAKGTNSVGSATSIQDQGVRYVSAKCE